MLKNDLLNIATTFNLQLEIKDPHPIVLIIQVRLYSRMETKGNCVSPEDFDKYLFYDILRKSNLNLSDYAINL